MSEKYRIELSIKAKNDIKSIVLYIKNNWLYTFNGGIE